MQRRDFIKHGGVAGILAAGAAPAFAQSAPTVKWRMTSSYPKSLDTLVGAAENVAKRVSDATGGRFQIQVFAAGEIVPGLQVLDAVQNGTVEVGQTIMYYYIGKNPTMAFGAIVPFGMNTRQHNAWWYQGGGSELFNDFLSKGYGCTGFPCLNTGTQMGGWFRKEIKTVADLKGLKFRVGGVAGAVLQRLGVVPQQLAGGDIYPALEKGTIDAAEWVGPYDDEKLGFAKIAKYYYTPGWWEGNAPSMMLVGTKAWESLPKDYQAIFTAACGESNAVATARYDHVNPAAMRKLIAGGTQLRVFSRDIMDACYTAAHAQYEEWGAKLPEFKKIGDSYFKYLEEELAWFRVAEGTFDNYMSSRAARKK